MAAVQHFRQHWNWQPSKLYSLQLDDGQKTSIQDGKPEGQQMALLLCDVTQWWPLFSHYHQLIYHVFTSDSHAVVPIDRSDENKMCVAMSQSHFIYFIFAVKKQPPDNKSKQNRVELRRAQQVLISWKATYVKDVICYIMPIGGILLGATSTIFFPRRHSYCPMQFMYYRKIVIQPWTAVYSCRICRIYPYWYIQLHWNSEVCLLW